MSRNSLRVLCKTDSHSAASCSLRDVTTADNRVKHSVEKTVGHHGGQKTCVASVLILLMKLTKSSTAFRKLASEKAPPKVVSVPG